MRLLCLGADTVNALISLHVPFDDLTPNGLWGTTNHLVGLRELFQTRRNIDVQALTCARLAGTWQEEAELLTL